MSDQEIFYSCAIIISHVERGAALIEDYSKSGYEDHLRCSLY